MGFRFQHPWWLLLLIPVIAVGIHSIRKRRRSAVLYSSVDLLRALPPTLALRFKRLLSWLYVLGLLLVVVALARPQRGLEEFRIRTEGIAIQMCLDRSGSMQAMDFQLDGEPVNRLTAVKSVFHDFVVGKGGLPGRPDDHIGLIAFGGFAEGLCPLTLDHGALTQVLETVEVPQPILDSRGRVVNERLWQEEQATAIGDSVVAAVARLRDVKAKSKVVILLSDGENTAGVVSPEAAAETAKTYGIKVYSIGVGSTGAAPFPFVDAFGRTVLRPQMVRLDEKTLTMLAETTGGHYFNAKDTETMESVYAEIDRLEKTESEGVLYTDYREHYHGVLLSGLGLVLLVTVLSCTRFRSLP